MTTQTAPIPTPAATPSGKSANRLAPPISDLLAVWRVGEEFPLLEVDWATSVEARRLFFMIGYFAEVTLPPLGPKDMYEQFYNITQIAQRGFFKAKSYCSEDFAAGNAPASAEMMQFDMIDETSHVGFGRT